MSIEMPPRNCALCGNSIALTETAFEASGDFLPDGDPLTAYANAPIHWACYADWPQRPRFARYHVDAWIKTNRANPFWWFVHGDDQVYISVNPSRPVEEASVRLCEFSSDIRIPLPKWAAWVANPDEVTPGLQPCERAALDKILPLLRERYPDDHSVVDAIDPNEKLGGRKRTLAKAGASSV